jgi:dethiobiotin synthetase
MNGLFFTGTDTGVGKTVVACAVARLLRSRGCPIRVCKPVATGAIPIAGRCLCEDTVRLAEAAGEPASMVDRITPWTFAEPLAPAVAARQAGVSLSLDEIVTAVRRQSQEGLVLVEGVGGLLCPLTDRETIADLAVLLGLPLIVVARRSLGTLNHALLTLEAADARGLRVAGVVLNATSPEDGPAERSNAAELKRRIAVPLLAEVPWQPQANPDVSPALAAIDWRSLIVP